MNTALNEVDAQYFGYEKTLEQVANMRRELEADIRAAAYHESRWKSGAGELEDC